MGRRIMITIGASTDVECGGCGWRLDDDGLRRDFCHLFHEYLERVDLGPHPDASLAAAGHRSLGGERRVADCIHAEKEADEAILRAKIEETEQ